MLKKTITAFVGLLTLGAAFAADTPAYTYDSINAHLLETYDLSLIQVVLVAALAISMLVVALSLFGVVTCYEDFNDLGFSMGIFAAPALMAVIASTIAIPFDTAVWLCIIPGVACLLVMIVKAFQNNKIWWVPLVILAKVTLSFLWLVYLYLVLAGETRKARGVAGFFWVILSAILLSVVRDKDGRFTVSRAGRIASRS